MNMKRRTFVQGVLASAIGVAISAVMVIPRAVLAAWPKQAFESKKVSDALNALMGTDATIESDKIHIKAPAIAENGAVVPITVNASMPAEAIAIIAEKNPSPLVVMHEIAPSAEAYVSTRIKMAETCDVIAVVKSEGKLYSARREVKVTIGGCGG